jgi:hypothetical protein
MRTALLRSGIAKWVGGLGAVLLSFGLIIVQPQTAYADVCSDNNGLACNVGYFSGVRDTRLGHNLFNPPALENVHNPQQLVSAIGNYLGCTGGVINGGKHGTSAAFIVLTMMGYPPGTPKNVACQAFGAWAQTVLNWPGARVNYDVPNYYFGGLNTRYMDSPSDVQYYFDSDRLSAPSIVFYNPTTGAPLYAIKKDCGNPVGRLHSIRLPYTLNPTVQGISPTQVIEPGTKMAADTRVTNTGQRTSDATQWEITMITVQPGKKAPHEDEGTTFSPVAPCQTGGGGPAGSYFQSADASCKNVDKGSRTFNPNVTSLNVGNVDIGDVPVGTRICFTLSVQPRTEGDGRWAHAKPVCTIVGKRPKVQVWGGDVAVRGKIDTSTSVKTIDGANKTFGSWVEYGAFSVGVNSKFASGSGLADQTNNNQVAWSKLTFANKNAAGADAFGQYAPAASFRPLPNVASFFGTIQNRQAIGGSVDLGQPNLAFVNTQPILVNTAGNLEITGGTIPRGKSVVIISSGTVTINGEIKYDDGAIARLQDIPQVVIIAQNINIRGDVPRIDAWLVASGTVNTCYDFTGNLTSAKCAAKLEVNGPVVTGKLLLNRTAGSDPGPASGDPAERFNLRPDAHLWAHMQSQGNNKAQTVYSVELPPRF